jgi:hypothetical protein
MHLLHLPEKYHISILDGVAGTCVLEQGLEVLSVHNTSKSNLVVINDEAGVKRILPIVSAITTDDPPVGKPVILIVHEGILNDRANHSNFSELQVEVLGKTLLN